MAAQDEIKRASAPRDGLDALLEDGYVVIPNALGEELCEAAIKDIDTFKRLNRRTIAQNLGENDRLHRVVNLHLAVDSLACVFSANSAMQLCDRFFDAETVLYTSLFFERGSEQDLHRDSPVFVTRPEGRYLGVWAALEDVDGDNGPLVVVPRSHSLPKLDVETMALNLYGDLDNAPAISDIGWATYQNAVKEQSEAHALASVEVHVRQGDVIVWHPLLFHGGAPHRSQSRTRRSLVMHVTPFGMPVYHQDVFFNSRKDVPDTASWNYYDHGRRKIAAMSALDFAHKYIAPVDSLQRV